MLATVMAEEERHDQGQKQEETKEEHGKEEDEEEDEKDEVEELNKRTVIITAFGVHDASYQLQVSQNNVHNFYRDQMPQEVLQEHGFRVAALFACREATARFVRAAAGVHAEVDARTDSPAPSEEQKEKDDEEHVRVGGRRILGLLEERRAQQRRRQEREDLASPVLVLPETLDGDGATPENNTTGQSSGNSTSNRGASASISADSVDRADAGGTVKDPGPLPPLVFVLQNNGYFDEPDDFQQNFLDEVHRIQRQEIGIGVNESEDSGLAAAQEVELARGSENNQSTDIDGISGDTNVTSGDAANAMGQDGGIFLVDNSVSLYKKLWCYRIDPSSHYHEPVKLVEAKMLWNLIALVDRQSSTILVDMGSGGADESRVEMGIVIGVVVAVGFVLASVAVMKMLYRVGRALVFKCRRCCC